MAIRRIFVVGTLISGGIMLQFFVVFLRYSFAGLLANLQSFLLGKEFEGAMLGILSLTALGLTATAAFLFTIRFSNKKATTSAVKVYYSDGAKIKGENEDRVKYLKSLLPVSSSVQPVDEQADSPPKVAFFPLLDENGSLEPLS